MCIRDSHQGRAVTARSEQSVLDEAVRLTKHPRFKGYIPVSYTHLDVYKRQGLIGAGYKMTKSGGVLITVRNSDKGAVSYTHLDVYKRQLYNHPYGHCRGFCNG